MRLSTFNRKDYLYNQRLVIIQKAHVPLQVRLQMLHNNIIDQRILELEGEYDDEPVKPSERTSLIFGEMGKENLLATNKDFQRLMRNSIVTQNHITQLEQLQASRSISDKITQVEIERVEKNLQYIEKTLSNAEVDIDKYKVLMEKMPRTVSRQDMLEKALTKGYNYKGREYSYKELNRLSRDLEKYKQNHLTYEKAKIENNQAQREGLGSVNQTKTWIWSTLEDTRHEELDGETVGLYEKFEVINSKTGDVDYLRFPGDIDNDHNNCSNICNCGCSYEIN